MIVSRRTERGEILLELREERSENEEGKAEDQRED